MSIALAPPVALTPSKSLSRSERLRQALNAFTVASACEAALIADDQGFLVAASDRLDGAQGEAWAAACVRALSAAADVQRMTGYRVHPEAAITVAAGQRLFVSVVLGAGSDLPLTLGVLGSRPADRAALKALSFVVHDTLGR